MREPARPYEERLEVEHPWAEVFDAAQRCCDRRRFALVVSADASTGRVVVVIRTRAAVGGAVLLVDVGSAPGGGTMIRIQALSTFVVDLLPVLRFHAARYRKALFEELAGRPREETAEAG